jgi:hypothetical protein
MLSIFTTRRCTAACDHCCVGASPRATAAIPLERIHRLIDEAARIPSMELIGFTGGECFLLGTDLDALVGHAAGNGFTTRVISNGYWAVNEPAARRRIGGLRARGLDEMMLSTGTFHQRFVPVERIVHAARAAADAGILTRISIEACDQSAFDDALLLAELAGPIARKQVYVGHSPWTTDAGGRGQTPLSHERWLSDGPARPAGRCAQVLTVIAVTPDQQLVSCCGFPLEELPQLRIGSVADRALDDVLDETPNELLKMWLHVAGPSGIADFVARYVPGYALPPSASICQSCVALQRDETAMRVIAEHAGDIVQSVADAFYRLQAGAEPVHAT